MPEYFTNDYEQSGLHGLELSVLHRNGHALRPVNVSGRRTLCSIVAHGIKVGS